MTDRSRRIAGAGLGLLLGLLYGAVSSLINSIALAGIPLRVDAPTLIAATIFAGLGAMAAGYVAAWPESSVKGILGGAVAIALFGVVKALLSTANAGQDFLRVILILIPSFLPAAAFALPITGLMRLGVNLYADAISHTGRPRLFRLGRLGLGVVALGVFAGSFGQMTPDEQAAVRQVNTILQNGLAAASDANLPSALRSISNFHARASRHYTLAQRTDVTTDFSVAGSSAVQMIAVDVLFDNGFHFQCRVGQSLAQPFCTED